MSKLRSGIPVLLGVLAMTIVVGCNTPLGGSVDEQGTIQVQIGTGSNSSRAVDSPTAQAETDFYEIIAYNGSVFTSTSVSASGGTAELAVPVGDYKVLVLAGTTGTYYAHLLGSGVSSEISVVQDQVTPVTVALNVASSTLTLSSSTVNTGDTFTVTVSANTGSPVLTMSGATDWVDFNDQQNWVTLTGQSATDSTTFTAPQSTGTYDVYYAGTFVSLSDADYGRNTLLSTSNGLGQNWYTLGSTGLSPALRSEVVKTLTVEVAATGIGVTIIWS